MIKTGSTDLSMVESASSKILSIITARDKSVGLKNKNILQLNGKMMFQYSLEYSQKLEKMFNLDTVITTDSQVILDYCKKNNVRYIERDQSLCQAKTRIDDVIYDVCKQFDGYDYLSLLYADIPTRYTSIFKDAISFLDSNLSYDCVMSMKHVKTIPSLMFKYDKDIIPRNGNIEHLRQNIERYMRPDSHTVLFKSSYFKEFMEGNRKYEYLYQQFGNKIKPIFHTKFVSSINNIDEFELVNNVIRYCID